MSINIRKIEPADLTVILDLMREFAEFEKLSHVLEVTEDRLRAAMFGEAGFVEGLIVDDDGLPVGHALFYPHFASFRAQRSLYLEDIYLKPEYRGQGVGESMIREIARTAASRGYERIDFQVLEWNTPAVKFYEKLGALRDDDERHYKFTDDAFRTLAA